MEKQETVVFYAWIDLSPQSDPKGTKAVPSKMSIAVSGGELRTDATGRKYREPFLEARFDAGKLITDNPEVIAAVRKLMIGDKQITESEEEFLRHVAEPLSLKKTTAQLETARKENADLRQKNKDLAEKLAGLKKLEAAEEALADALAGDKPAAAAEA